MKIRTVIVNYKTPQLVIDCLRSLDAEVRDLGDCRVIVVENASGDDSAAKIRAAIAENNWAWADLIVAEKNLGFAGGNNVALRPVLAEQPPPDYVWLLNPDTYIRPGALKELVNFLEANPRAGIAGSRLEDPDGTPQRSAFRFFTLASEFETNVKFGPVSRLLSWATIAPPVRDEPHVCDWLAGASMLVRRAVFDAIGVMDQDYFLYYEETDFCLLSTRAGWPCWYVPASRVVHLVGQSTGVTVQKVQPKRTPRYWFESRRRYFLKNHGKLYYFLANVCWATGFALWRLRRRVQGKPDLDPPHMLGDFLRFNFLGA
jgi:GT2 family glycosyltransferase